MRGFVQSVKYSHQDVAAPGRSKQTAGEDDVLLTALQVGQASSANLLFAVWYGRNGPIFFSFVLIIVIACWLWSAWEFNKGKISYITLKDHRLRKISSKDHRS